MVELQTALENEHDLDERERLRSSVAGDSRAAWQFARESGAFEALKAIQTPKPWRSSLSIVRV